MSDPLGLVKDAPSGQVPFVESRFATRNIQLSSALCALGFSLKIDAQPVSITVDGDTTCRIVTFFHEGATKLGDFLAIHVDLWWNSPRGKYTIVGYDDALTAMKRVHSERARMIDISKRGQKFHSNQNTAVATQSLHSAAVLGACEISLLGYDPSNRQWVFASGAEIICDLIKAGGRPKDRPLTNYLCVDWMLEALRYRDWLAKLLRDPECIPLIEMRDGEKVLMVSSGMNKREQTKWISHL